MAAGKRRRIRPSNLDANKAQRRSWEYGKRLLGLDPRLFEKRAGRRRAARVESSTAAKFVQRQLGKMQLKEVVPRLYRRWRQELPIEQALVMVPVELHQHIVKFLDLPESKNRALRVISRDLGIVAKANNNLITKRSALRLLEQVIKVAEQRLRGASRPSMNFVREIKDKIEEFKSMKKKAERSRGNQVLFEESVWFDIVEAYQREIHGIVAGKNAALLYRADQEASRILKEVIELEVGE